MRKVYAVFLQGLGRLLESYKRYGDSKRVQLARGEFEIIMLAVNLQRLLGKATEFTQWTKSI